MEPRATVVVVPREQFSKALMSLESIRASTEMPHSLVYVDGNSPSDLAGHLEFEAERGGLTLVRQDHYLTGSEARNLGLEQVHTEYVVFIDNDVLVWPGWLESLVRCADETGAWVVGPLYLIGGPMSREVHTAGADLELTETGGGRHLGELHHHCGETMQDAQAAVGRSPYDEVEFHCLLSRTDAFDHVGPLDEGLLSFFDHTDFCLSVREAGGRTFTESAAVVTYLPPTPLAWSDLPFFLLRWSEVWYSASLDHFCRKWGIDPKDPVFGHHVRYRKDHRRRLPTAYSKANQALDLVLGPPLERTLVRRLERKRARQPRVSGGTPVPA